MGKNQDEKIDKLHCICEIMLRTISRIGMGNETNECQIFGHILMLI